MRGNEVDILISLRLQRLGKYCTCFTSCREFMSNNSDMLFNCIRSLKTWVKLLYRQKSRIIRMEHLVSMGFSCLSIHTPLFFGACCCNKISPSTYYKHVVGSRPVIILKHALAMLKARNETVKLRDHLFTGPVSQ